MDNSDSQTQTTTTPIMDDPVQAPSGVTNVAPLADTTVTEPMPTSDIPEPATAPAPTSDVTEPTTASASSSVIVDPTLPPADYADAPAVDEPNDIIRQVVAKIADSKNILIALSADPSVDEMSSAIGLSLFLDRLGKRATAIYSGSTPNALEFLKPEETFEPTADALQDFVIALNKEKADHLRYKLDGEFVKIFITPYRTRIAEEDLEFSYGDFNVDLVLALDVANGVDLDSALREHGRIMHDATIINITTGKPGKFGEIEWSDTTASSISEMIATLLYSMNTKIQIEKEEATAFLTGIVAATNRFSTASTRPETMRLASRLMESGANQQLVSKNITPDVDNEMLSLYGHNNNMNAPVDTDPTKLDIEHAGEEGIDETKVVEANVTEKESTLLDDLKAAEESLSKAGAETTPESRSDLFKLEDSNSSPDSVASEASKAPEPEAPEAKSTEPELPKLPEVPEASESIVPDLSTPESEAPEAKTPEPLAEPAPESTTASEPTPEPTLPEPVSTDTPDTTESSITPEGSEKVIKPSAEFANETSVGTEDYSKMLEDALSEVGGASVADINAPIMSQPDEPVAPETPPAPAPGFNPAMVNAPSVPTNPEINGVPSMNYMPMPGEEVLPPPPAPPIDINAPIPGAMPATAPTMPATAPVMPDVGPQPVMTDQVYIPQASDPSAFKIPGI